MVVMSEADVNQLQPREEVSEDPEYLKPTLALIANTIYRQRGIYSVCWS